MHPFSYSMGAVSPTVWRSIPWVLPLVGVRVDIEDAKDGVADARQLTPLGRTFYPGRTWLVMW